MKRLLFAIAAAALLAAAPTMRAAQPDTGSAAAYCTSTGGQVIERAPVYGTNGPSSTWLWLTGKKNFCEYYDKSTDSSIHVLLETLYSTKPTLAALAYYNKPPVGTCEGNPASCYCSQLGGSDLFGGITGAGGGWVGSDYPYNVLEACIFPDMSSIDSWGLTYNAEGIIRGIDLTTVLRYAPPPSATHE
jgi:putative hemolysin